MNRLGPVPMGIGQVRMRLPLVTGIHDDVLMSHHPLGLHLLQSLHALQGAEVVCSMALLEPGHHLRDR